jgi:hypothetical protein
LITGCQQLKDGYFANVNSAKSKVAEKTDDKKEVSSSKQKKPVPKKKAAEDDPFASDDNDEDHPKPIARSKKHTAGAKRSKESDTEGEEPPTKKKS